MFPSVRRDSAVTGRVLNDVVDSFTGSIPMTITYNNRVVTSGVEFRTSVVTNPPRIQIGGQDFRNLYTLVMVDPDAPTPTNPTLREYLHWMVTDIPETTTVNFGNEIFSYEGPKPTAGIHRIVFVLFLQPLRSMIRAITNQARENFNTRQFADSYSLGSPVAVVYFNCQRERGSGGRRFM